MCGREDCVVDAAGAESGRVVIAECKRYRVCCGGLVGAAFSCEVLGEGQSGICVEVDVASARRPRVVGAVGCWLSTLSLLRLLA